jgi:putative ABC transport system substrate-binding protein
LLKRRCAAALALAALLLLAAQALAASAATADKVAVICDREVAPYRALLEGLTSACNCTVRVIPPREAKPEGLEQRLKAEGVRAVLAVGLQAQAAVEGVRDLPVVLTMVPQVAPWVAAQANRSGVEMSLPPRRHLETLRRVFPRAKRIGLVFDPAQTGDYVREAQAAAAELNLALETREIARPGELSSRLEELRGRVDVIWVLPDPTVLQGENLNLLLLASFESRVPLYGFARKYVELGAIAASQVDFAALGDQVAGLVRRVSLKPAGVAPPRWEYARGAQLVLNQKVARKMGIVFDPEVLEDAADVLR